VLQSFYPWVLDVLPTIQSQQSPNRTSEISTLSSYPGRPGTLVSILIPPHNKTIIPRQIFFRKSPRFDHPLDIIQCRYITRRRHSRHILQNIVAGKMFYRFPRTLTECIFNIGVRIPVRKRSLRKLDKIPIYIVGIYNLFATTSTDFR